MGPKYSKNNPRGWCGDPRRGAALGRPTIRNHDSSYVGTIHISHVRLDADGYDPYGTYFGIGGKMYWISSDDGGLDYMERGVTIWDVISKVEADFLKAKVTRNIVGLPVEKEVN